MEMKVSKDESKKRYKSTTVLERLNIPKNEMIRSKNLKEATAKAAN